MYKNSPISPETKWPPTPSREYITLAVVEGGQCRDEYIGHTLQGSVQQLLDERREISTEQILEAPGGQDFKLILIEGAPGIGKSTLAWELCRKWEEFSCMQQYSLVVLLRLREEEVQNITKVSELFYAYESENKKFLEQDVLESQGKGILFILDGFDEFPKNLQRKSFILNLIQGFVLPASTVLVTSRPSSTAQLLTSCRPQKHVEILGFTQESVEAYANSVFVAEPEKLKGFKAYISISSNPAINSLMYVPLNAAIVVQIYRNSKSDRVLPHTLTELYTQLCLTILNRYLTVHNPTATAAKFADFPGNIYSQFLKLCKVAFIGMENEAVIFKIHSAFDHFGFLDAVSALYGGGEISYNFLHLTLQEFLAAYHISQLGGRGQELLKRYGKKYRWKVVWRFVAGLTKFKHFTAIDMNRVFCHKLSHDTINVSDFFIECLFEAKTTYYFSSSIRAASTLCIHANINTSPFGMYALGYCIANIYTGKPWSLDITGVKTNALELFVSGLRTKIPGVGITKKVALIDSEASLANLTFYFPTVDILVISNYTACDEPILQSDYIARNTSLTELAICNTTLVPSFLLLLLQQLYNSNVTSLDIMNSGFCKHFRESSQNFYPALEKLIDPSFGRLGKLSLGDYEYDKDVLSSNSDVMANTRAPDDDLVRLVSSHSSLKCLSLHGVLSSLFPLKSNTCLTELSLRLTTSERYHQQQLSTVINVVKVNKTLQHLDMEVFGYDDIIDAVAPLKAIAHTVITENSTLQSVELEMFDFGNQKSTTSLYPTLSDYMRTHHEELTVDPRITWSS